LYQPTRSESGPPVALILISINVLVFLISAASNSLFSWFALWPVGSPEIMQVGNQVLKVPTFWPWQLISYGFLHGSLTHIFFNMFALYLFGLPLEAGWGRSRFALYYLVCLVGAGLVQLVVASTSAEIYPTVGASGAVFGLLLAYGLRFPNNVIVLLIPPIPIKAKYFVILYGAAELLFGVTGMMPGVAHFAHLGGMLFGLVLLWKWGWRPGR
jgi:membrane associated rhomboid family serine protease